MRVQQKFQHSASKSLLSITGATTPARNSILCAIDPTQSDSFGGLGRKHPSYGLTESGLTRLIRKTYELLGLISFFTVGEDECRAWTIERGMKAQQAAGTIHTDLEHHFIRAETIHWDQLLDAGSEANARAKGILRLEGKEYLVKDGDVMHIRHSG